MASNYNKNNWTGYVESLTLEEQPDAIITEAKLDHMEDGIELANYDLAIGEVKEGAAGASIVIDQVNKVKKINLSIPKCETGKSAYEYAKDGGYTGTETEFAQKLAKEIPDIDEQLSTSSTNPLQNKIITENINSLSNNKADKDSLTQEISDRKEEVTVERARIDSLASLSEGSTTGDAELQDIRVGYDGTTYDTAGNAVRSQIGKLSDDKANQN